MASNLFTILSRLVAGGPLQIGTVTSISSSIATVELPGGGLITARGSTSVGATVFVRDGVIEGDAPSLPVDEVDV